MTQGSASGPQGPVGPIEVRQYRGRDEEEARTRSQAEAAHMAAAGYAPVVETWEEGQPATGRRAMLGIVGNRLFPVEGTLTVTYGRRTDAPIAGPIVPVAAPVPSTSARSVAPAVGLPVAPPVAVAEPSATPVSRPEAVPAVAPAPPPRAAPSPIGDWTVRLSGVQSLMAGTAIRLLLGEDELVLADEKGNPGMRVSFAELGLAEEAGGLKVSQGQATLMLLEPLSWVIPQVVIDAVARQRSLAGPPGG